MKLKLLIVILLAAFTFGLLPEAQSAVAADARGAQLLLASKGAKRAPIQSQAKAKKKKKARKGKKAKKGKRVHKGKKGKKRSKGGKRHNQKHQRSGKRA